ncbi:DNA-binding MarR family transcriptional regulator [Nocardioides albertanoniae]|uniref:DNA-binding MarR family transcriptional regulator n=1 Tax=Nocardioides albertanoniae TaxID=1175486 RepID=A0A543A2V2_9ACTN|nr:MarR family winged helix-turn-helix transcriptional regulator [Nocardioides albertanoniae]TQL66919.1 DNA-binding MarR family transcriptional regulator [Nocardioides albertanoniae]
MPSTTPSSTDRTLDQVRAGLRDERRVASLLWRLEVHRRLAEDRSALNQSDGRLLWFLSDGRPRTLREIADGLNLEQSTVNRQVNAALSAGHLRRFAEPGLPARLIEPTEEGLALYEAASARALGAYADGLAALGDDSDEFLDLLETFVGAYGEAVRE